MYATSYEQAKKQARANADYFGRTYYVIIDTSGNYRCERDFCGEACTVFVAQPAKRPVQS